MHSAATFLRSNRLVRVSRLARRTCRQLSLGDVGQILSPIAHIRIEAIECRRIHLPTLYVTLGRTYRALASYYSQLWARDFLLFVSNGLALIIIEKLSLPDNYLLFIMHCIILYWCLRGGNVE